ncbi:MAG: biotin/lipoyl-containing protein [Mangrovibacterium sp.]
MAEEKAETIIVHSAVYQTEYSNKYRKREKWERPDKNQILSFMPGTIIDVYVKPGELVKKGEALLILEAMKMHNNVLMPFDGKIEKIHVSPGDKVHKRFNMLEIKPLKGKGNLS